MDFYLKDFSAGLVTKNVYGRTDLDLYKKGLVDMKDCKTNPYGNIENSKIDLSVLSEINLLGAGYDGVIDNIKNGNYIVTVYKREEIYDYDEIFIYENILVTFNNTGKLVVINLTQKTSVYKTIDVSIYNFNYRHEVFSVNINKIFFYEKDLGYAFRGTYNRSGEVVERIFLLKDFSDLYCYTIGNLIETRPYKTTLLRLDDYSGRIEFYFKDTSTGTIYLREVKEIKFSYDIRKNYATIKFLDFSGNEPFLDGTLAEQVYIERNYFLLSQIGELEIFLGKFVNVVYYFDEFKILNTPTKDTTKVDSSGNVTVEEITLEAKEVLIRKTMTKSEFSSLIDDVYIKDGRMFILRKEKLYASVYNDYKNFYNTSNSNYEGFSVDLPFEKVKQVAKFNDNIFFSNRGVFYMQSFPTPTSNQVYQVDTSVISDNIKPMAIYGGVSFIDVTNKRVLFMSYNDEVKTYEISDLSLLIDTGELKVMDYINNGKEKESIIVSDDTNSYLFTMDIIEQYRYWTKTNKLNIDFSFFDETGNTIYCGIDTVNSKIIYYDDDIVNGDFEFTIFKPDIYIGQQTPAYFNRNLIVKEIEIMYTGNGKISVYNNSKDIPTVIVDELVFTDQFYKPFDGEVKISKSAVHLQWGDILKFKVETQGEFRIMAINLKS